MDYTNSDKDIILEIEQYMNDKGEALISRMKYIIDKFEVYKTKKNRRRFQDGIYSGFDGCGKFNWC